MGVGAEVSDESGQGGSPGTSTATGARTCPVRVSDTSRETKSDFRTHRSRVSWGWGVE